LDAVPIPSHGHNYSLSLVLPPLGIVFLKSEAPAAGTIPPQAEPALGE
jgi:1,4-alpha-glucan branching enzyme